MQILGYLQVELDRLTSLRGHVQNNQNSRKVILQSLYKLIEPRQNDQKSPSTNLTPKPLAFFQDLITKSQVESKPDIVDGLNSKNHFDKIWKKVTITLHQAKSEANRMVFKRTA